jgi:glycosidase
MLGRNNKNLKKILSVITIAILIVSCCFAQKQSVIHPQWTKNVGIYEANIRQHSEQSTFREFEKYLPELKEMGIGIVWLMPIHPIGEKNRKGTLGSYYSVRDYKGINPEFGTSDDFRQLVNKIHELGMYVIIDWVANHTAWDHSWTISNPEFYTKDSTGNFVIPSNWTDVIDLNYSNQGLREAMLDALVYWVKEFDIDGYRCDVAAMVPSDFWVSVRDTLDKIKPVFMLAEATEPHLHEQAFDMTYGWQFKDLFNDIAAGEKTSRDLKIYYEKREKANYHTDAYRMLFTSNHDENSWHGTVFERLGEGAEAFAVFTCVFRGMPLIYGGQEAGLDKRLEFFEKDTIEWREHGFREMYTKLFKLKKENKALWNGIAGGDIIQLSATDSISVYAFARQKDEDKIVAVFNFSAEKQSLDMTVGDFRGKYWDVFSDQKVDLKKIERLELDGWGYKVFGN